MPFFFIRRPIVAMVISIVIVILGLVALSRTPVEQYPRLAPPNVQIEANYTGANAEVVEQSVATPIEDKINGVDKMLYMKSVNSSDGRMSLQVTFDVGMDFDTANTLTQNRVSQATSQLPGVVNQLGVTVKKVNPSILMVVSLFSPQDRYDDLFLNNYARLNVRDQLLRVKGVSEVDIPGGSEYGMRIWIDPDRLAKLGLVSADVINAIQRRSMQAPAGQVGGAPSGKDQLYTYTVQMPGPYDSPEKFGEIAISTKSDGRQILVKDVARIELGGQYYRGYANTGFTGETARRLLGESAKDSTRPACAIVIKLLPDANQLESAELIYAKLKEIQPSLNRDGIEYHIPYDTTPAVQSSISAIVKTLLEAVVLVVLVVYLFLQNWRATLIPLLTVPVSLLGTFILFPMLGFSVNTLSLFGMVLAIGIVVDDAIVVVEAVMHHIERGMKPREAAVQAMKEVAAPVVGIALILSAVFVPVAFMGGLSGMLYKQFALTIALSVLISAFNALSLSPALAALLLKPHGEGRRSPFAPFFKVFNRFFDFSTNRYIAACGILVRRAGISLLLIACIGGGAWSISTVLPGGFVPTEDQGILVVNVELPPARSLEQTRAATGRIDAILGRTPGVDSFISIGGMSFIMDTNSPNMASYFVRLTDWKERTTPELQASAIADKLTGQLIFGFPYATAFVVQPPSIPGFGMSGGFSFMLEDRTHVRSVQEMGEIAKNFMGKAMAQPEIGRVMTAFNPNTPQIKVEPDFAKIDKLGIDYKELSATIQTALGGTYVNDFNRYGRLYKVYVQSEASHRRDPDDIGRFHIRTKTGEMVPLSTVLRIDDSAFGAEATVRYNLYRSVEFAGTVKPGFSSGQGIAALKRLAADPEVLPRGMALEFSGLTYQEASAPSAVPTYVFAVGFVFLLLAALYESWTLPWSVLLGTPLVMLGALGGVWLSGYADNVYVQVGLVMLIGLAAKNAILIVEFAKVRREQGKTLESAALEAARLRFRPILMTAFAFILGVVPLMVAHGSGAVSRQVMGTAVFWGMLVATMLGVVIIPSLFVIVERLAGKGGASPAPAEDDRPDDASAHTH